MDDRNAFLGHSANSGLARTKGRRIVMLKVHIAERAVDRAIHDLLGWLSEEARNVADVHMVDPGLRMAAAEVDSASHLDLDVEAQIRERCAAFAGPVVDADARAMKAYVVLPQVGVRAR